MIQMAMSMHMNHRLRVWWKVGKRHGKFWGMIESDVELEEIQAP